MVLARRALLVTPNLSLSNALAATARRAGLDVYATRTFRDARRQLDSLPSLLITDLKLGEYNGLHLVLRCQSVGIPSIVVADDSFEIDVERLGATWMSPEAAVSDELQPVVSRLLDRASGPASATGWHHDDWSNVQLGTMILPSVSLH